MVAEIAHTADYYYYEFWMGEESAGEMKKYKEVKRGA